MNNAVIRFPEGRRKAFTLSYDDGVVEDRRLIEILNRYGLKATFNLSSYPIIHQKGRSKVNINELKCTYRGHEIAVHSWTHPCPSETFYGNFAYEIMKDREILEDCTGQIVCGMAYPMGSSYVNEDNVRTVRQCGIAYARTTTPTSRFDLPEDWALWNPTCHHKDPEVLELLKSFIQMDARLSSKLFYLWGHSYEFEDDGRWDLAEEIAQTISGRKDIWYATNGEICSYLTAARSLTCSANGNMLFNPTAFPIWLEILGQSCKLMPGETMVLSQFDQIP